MHNRFGDVVHEDWLHQIGSIVDNRQREGAGVPVRDPVQESVFRPKYRRRPHDNLPKQIRIVCFKKKNVSFELA